MAVTPISDFNVVSELTMAPTPVEKPLPANSIEADTFRRAIRELEAIRDGIPEPMRSDLTNQIGSLQAQFNATGIIPANMASALQDARGQATQYTTITALNSSAALYNAIDSAGGSKAWFNSYRLSEAGQARADNIVELFKNGQGEEAIVAGLRQPPTDAEKTGALEYSRSHDGRKEIAEFQRLLNGTPEEQAAAKKAVTDRAKLDELAKSIERDPKILPETKRLIGLAHRADALKGEAGVEIVAAALQGKPAAEIESNVTNLVHARMKALHGQVNSQEQIYSPLPGFNEGFMKSLTAEQAEKAAQGSDGFAAVATELYMRADKKQIGVALARVHGDPTRLDPATRSAFYAMKMLETTSGETRQKHVRDETLVMLRDAGLSARNQQRQEDAMGTMLDGNATIADRARAAYLEIDKAKDQGRVDSKDYAMGMSALVFAFANTRGNDPKVALAEYQEKSNAKTPAALQYQRDFQAFVDRGVGTITEDYARLAQNNAIAALGRQIGAKQIDIMQDDTGKLTFYNSQTFDTRATFLDEKGLAGLDDDYSNMMRDMLRETRRMSKNGTDEDKQLSGMLRKMDTYRLQYDAQWQPLIHELYYLASDQKTLPQAIELLKANSGKILDEVDTSNRRYAGYAKDIASGLETEQKAELLRKGILSGSGEIDVAKLMQVVEDNKMNVGLVYRKYLEVPTTVLREANQELQAAEYDAGGKLIRAAVTTGDLANARMVAEVANQFRGADAVDQLVYRADKIEEQVALLKKTSQAIPPSLQAEHDILQIVNEYDASKPTMEQREKMVLAVRTFMERDPYIAEKELADKYFTNPADRADIVDKVVKIIEQRAMANGQTLAAGAEVSGERAPDEDRSHNHGRDLSPVPVNVISDKVLEAKNARMVNESVLQIPDLNLPITSLIPEKINENEGAGLFDRVDMDMFERQIFEAVKGLSAESRRTMFGESKVLNEVNKGLKDEDAVYSYNEIETALKRLKLDGIEKITDVNGNGFDAEDIRAALVPGAAPLNNGQGNGR